MPLAFRALSTLLMVVAFPAFGQVHQSSQTREFTLGDEFVVPTPAQLHAMRRYYFAQFKYYNDLAEDEGGVGPARRFLRDYVKPPLDYITEGVPGLEGAPDFVQHVQDKLYEANAQAYRARRDFGIQLTIDLTARKIVEACNSDSTCAAQYHATLMSDPLILEQLQKANALGAHDGARTRALLETAIQRDLAATEAIADKVDDVEAKVLETLADTRQQMAASFSKVIGAQQKLIEDTAAILDAQQQHAIALQSMRDRMEKNLNNIAAGVGEVRKLQLQNMLISGAILSTVSDIRTTQLADIFNRSPLAQQIEMLQDPTSEYFALFRDEARAELLVDLQAARNWQDIAQAAEYAATGGTVAVAALNTFCEECPPELSNSIQQGVELANIVGNAATGNYGQALLGAIGLFGSGGDPQLAMLQQIDQRLEQLEQNMSAHFLDVHRQLFQLEENLVIRLDLIDQKLNALGREVFLTRIEIMEELTQIEAQLSYIVVQNDCQDDTILKLAQADQDSCRVPAGRFQLALGESRLQSFEDLDNFFRGNFCADCVKALFGVSNRGLQDAPFFRFSACQREGADPKARPDRAYEFIYSRLLGAEANDPAVLAMLVVPPNHVTDISVMRSHIEESAGEIDLASVPGPVAEDAEYRYPDLVLRFASYVLTLFPFLELYEAAGTRLFSPDELQNNPGLSWERAGRMVDFLEDVKDLVVRTQMQQSVMSGHALMDVIEERLQEGDNLGDPGTAFFSLADLFAVNPYLRKNFSAYLLDKTFGGFPGFAALVQSGRLSDSPIRIAQEGYSTVLRSESDGSITFSAALTNEDDPTRNIELFTVTAPGSNGVIDELEYRDYLEFVVTPSAIQLEEMRIAVTAKLGEMKLITSPEIDSIEGPLTRGDIESLVAAYRERVR